MVASANSPESWRPPSFYWQLMRTPITARAFQQLSEKEHRSEFLLAFNQDLLTMEACYNAVKILTSFYMNVKKCSFQIRTRK
jgi:hypothetical protein